MVTVKTTPRGARVRGRRRGQAEIIGGLIVLTLIFMFAVPIMLNAYYGAQRSVQATREAQLSLATGLNERLAVGPVLPTELALRAGWIPGVWINNTGTTPVTLSKLYLINTYNNTIYAIIDLRTARPGGIGGGELITKMLLNPVAGLGVSEPLPPAGTPITLNPGDNLLIVFNQTKLMGVAQFLVARVESASGILHPLLGGGGGAGEQTLLGGRPGAGGEGAVGGAGVLWRGVFAPQSGFSLRGYDDLAKSGEMYAWRPPLHVYPDVDSDWWYEPEDLDYYESFIYEDPEYPGLYYLYIRVAESTYLIIDEDWTTRVVCDVYSGYTIIVRGFVGTYDTGGDGYGTYFNGYAFEVSVLGRDGSEKCHIGPFEPVRLTDESIRASDFDGNGIQEITFYSYLNGPNYSPDDRVNIDADYSPDYTAYNDYSKVRDALVWTYMVARDLSGIDYVSVTVKVNYYWTTTFSSSTGCPSWNYRHLKIFSIIVWRYNNSTRSWEVYQYQNFGFTSEKPVQFQPTVTFPLNRHEIYRVGVMFFDNYRDWDGYGYWCFTDFTMTLEHMIVEYGVVNPLFQESPPLYIVAIPDPHIISDIGEDEYAAMTNETIDEAKVDALASMVSKLKEELNYAGIAGYTIIDSYQKFCDLLFSDNAPKYAVIYWLQGAVDPADVAREAGCSLTDWDLRNIMLEYHWVWVSPYGIPFGDPTKLSVFESSYADLVQGPFNMTITEAGIKARKDAYAFYLYNILNFTYGVRNYTDSVMIMDATFYMTEDSNWKYFGTAALWLWTGSDFGDAVLVLNPVHVDWDANGDGALPETIVQQIVYSSLRAWSILSTST